MCSLTPVIAATQQDQEIVAGQDFLCMPQFVNTNPHDAMIASGFSWNSPTQVNRLELKTAHKAVMLQARENVTLESVALFLQVTKDRTDKDSNNRADS